MKTFAPDSLHSAQIHHFSNLMAEAFLDYPLYTYSIPDERSRRKSLPYLFEALLHYALKNGSVHATDDSQAVSLWLLPSKTGISTVEFMRKGGVRFVLEAGVPASLKLSGLIDHTIRNRKDAGKVNCWYLYIIAVHPTAQGKGLGKALIREAGASIQPENGVWLETCKRANADIYSSLGFKFCFIEPIEGTSVQTHGMYAERIT